MEDSYFFIVYVDDCILFNNQSPLIHHIKTILFHEFEMFNEVALQYTIHNAIIRNYEKNKIMHQATYFIAKLLYEFGWLKAIQISQEQRK